MGMIRGEMEEKYKYEEIQIIREMEEYGTRTSILYVDCTVYTYEYTVRGLYSIVQ